MGIKSINHQSIIYVNILRNIFFLPKALEVTSSLGDHVFITTLGHTTAGAVHSSDN